MNSSRVLVSAPAPLRCSAAVVSSLRYFGMRQRACRRFDSLTIRSSTGAASSDQSQFISTVGSPTAIHPTRLAANQREIQFLSYAAFAAATSATLLFCAAIPTLLAFKRAAKSLEKLMDTTREELPSTMASIRLSGMELSDLTMELSEISQGITQGVRSSTQAVHLAGERLRRLANINSTGYYNTIVTSMAFWYAFILSFSQIVTTQEVVPRTVDEPAVAKTARTLREGIVKSRGFLQPLFILTQYSKSLLSFISRAKA